MPALALPTMDKNGYELVDWREISWSVCDGEVDFDLKVGDHVKLTFDFANGLGREHLWINITQIHADEQLLVGKLKNHPVVESEDTVQFDDNVVFGGYTFQQLVQPLH